MEPKPNLTQSSDEENKGILSTAKPASSRKPRARFAPEYELLLQRLIARRREVGVTQGEVARALGKTQSHVSMCENREREISIIDLWRWCLVLGVAWSDFIRELEGEITPHIDV